MNMYYCTLCCSKVLENRVQKHHEKVHASIEDDIYQLLPAEEPNNNQAATNGSPVDNVWKLEPPKDDNMVHVRCDVCANKMPKCQLDAHMKRKHAEPADQVDAIATTVVELPVAKKTLPKIGSPFTMKSMTSQLNESFQRNCSIKEPAKDVIDLGPSSKVGGEPPYYNIRVTENQMQQLLNENRIFPKDGAFCLKL